MAADSRFTTGPRGLTRLRRITGISLGAALLVGGWFAPMAHAAEPLDHSDRAAVQAAYLTGLLPALDVPVTWVGSVSDCTPGMASVETRDATIDAVNWFREFVGLSPVAEDEAMSARAQEMALMMEANKRIDHHPTPDWTCYTQVGADVAEQSNLSLGIAGAASIVAYMDDSDAFNRDRVGHRRWIINPATGTMGVGATEGAGDLQVQGATNPNANHPAWIPWPAAGYFPSQLLNKAWSLSSEGANFTAATVSMKKNGEALTGITVQPVAAGYGPNTLVWQLPDSVVAPTGPGVDTYDVSVKGVAGGSAASFDYSVKVFNVPAVTAGKVFPSGTANVGQTLTATASEWTPMPTSFSYQWYRTASGGTTTKIPEATGAAYKLQPADQGYLIGVKAKGYLDGYAAASSIITIRGGLVGPKLALPAGSAAVTGTPKVGAQLAASTSGWGDGTTLSYQWLRGGTPIAGATESTFVPGVSEVGAKVAVRVTGANPDYASTQVTSASVTVAASAPSAPPVSSSPTTAPPATPTPMPPAPVSAPPQVELAKAKVKKVTVGKRQATVSWTNLAPKKAKPASWQVSYLAKGSSATKVKAVAGSKSSIVVKSLQRGKSYVVRVRAVLKISNNTWYGPWSAAKTSGKVK